MRRPKFGDRTIDGLPVCRCGEPVTVPHTECKALDPDYFTDDEDA